MHMWGTNALVITAFMWKSGHVSGVNSTLLWGSRGSTQVVRLDSSHLSPLYLASPLNAGPQ